MELLSVRQVEEYLFCPMLFYYREALGLEAPQGLWSETGKQAQTELSSYVESTFKILGKQVYLESRRLGLCGTVDYVVEGPAPLEVKHSRRLRPWWRYTLVLYALLVEESYGKPVKRAYLVLPHPRTVVLEIRDEDRRYALHALHSARRILAGNQPRPAESRSCANCDFNHLCKT